MGKVSIVKTRHGLQQSLSKLIDSLGGFGNFISPDDRVMLKPNLNDYENFTSAELTSALIKLLLDFKVKNIFIAESTFGNGQITQHCNSKFAQYDSNLIKICLKKRFIIGQI